MNSYVQLAQIEQERQKLYQMEQQYQTLGHPEVIKQSQILDNLLNHYHQNKSYRSQQPILITTFCDPEPSFLSADYCASISTSS